MKINTTAFLLPIGIALGFAFRYEALQLSRFTFFFSFLLIFINFLHFDFGAVVKKNNFRKNLKLLLVSCFVSLFFQTSIQFLFLKVMGLDERLILGVVIAGLCPFALVAPAFCKSLQWKDESSYLMVIGSHLLFPLILPLGLTLFEMNSFYINRTLLFVDSLILTVLPIILVLLFNKTPRLKELLRNRTKKHMSFLNLVFIAFIAWTCTGAFLTKTSAGVLDMSAVLSLVGVALFQDFGSILVGRFFAMPADQVLTMSMKNVLVGASLSLIYFPRAALPCLLVLLVHSILFAGYRAIFSGSWMNTIKSH